MKLYDDSERKEFHGIYHSGADGGVGNVHDFALLQVHAQRLGCLQSG